MDLVFAALGVRVADLRGVGQVIQDFGDVAREADVAAVALTGCCEVDEYVVLRVQPHGGVDEFFEIDAVGFTVEAQVDAFVFVAAGLHAGVHAGFGQHFHGTGFEDASAVGVRDGFVIAFFDHDVLDALLGEQVGEHEAGGAAADDTYLGFFNGWCHEVCS